MTNLEKAISNQIDGLSVILDDEITRPVAPSDDEAAA